MTNYIIAYSFNGNGMVKISANNKEEAREKFFDGDFTNEDEYGENFFIEKVTAK